MAIIVCLPLLGCHVAQPDPQEPTETQTEAVTPESSEASVPESTAGETSEPTQPQTQPTEPEPTDPPKEELLTGDIYITTSAPLSAEYSEAQVRVEWPDGGIPEQTVRIKHRGNLSLTYADKKSYNIKFDEKVSFLGMESGKKWCLLACHFDKSLLRSMIGFEYARNIGLPYASQTRLCRLWLDGVYMGVYTAIEPVEEGKSKVDIDLDAGDFLFERNAATLREEADVTYFHTNSGMRFELNEPEEPTADQLSAILSRLNQIEAAIMSMDHTQYEKVIDVDSFVNYYILHELIKDIDFGAFSARYFVKDGILYAGPPWDMDLTMGNVSVSHYEDKYKLYHNIEGQGNGSGDSSQGPWAAGKDFFIWLAEDPYFMDLVKARWQELKPITKNIVQDNALGQCRIDLYMQEAGALLESNYTADGAGWNVSKPNINLEYSYPAKDYAGNVQMLKQWLTSRIAWIDAPFTETAG